MERPRLRVVPAYIPCQSRAVDVRIIQNIYSKAVYKYSFAVFHMTDGGTASHEFLFAKPAQSDLHALHAKALCCLLPSTMVIQRAYCIFLYWVMMNFYAAP